jgi:hypothetical protein
MAVVVPACQSISALAARLVAGCHHGTAKRVTADGIVGGGDLSALKLCAEQLGM